MSEILTLKPEGIEKRIHPQALQRYREWRDEVRREVPLQELSNDDLNMYLTDGEKRDFERYMGEITRGLVTCMDIEDGDSVDALVKNLAILQFKGNSLLPMFQIKSLLQEVHKRKTAEAEAERKKLQEKERWQAAFKALKPPLQKAKMFLNSKEYGEFEGSISGAVDAYLAKGEGYLSDKKTDSYQLWCIRISNRQKEKEARGVAKCEMWEYNHRLNDEIGRLKSTLSPEKQSPEAYFDNNIVDFRYTGQSFVHLLTDEDKRLLMSTIDSIVRVRLDRLVPGDFSKFIYSECQTYCFLLPLADYSFDGLPCLKFSFEAFAVVETKICLKPGQKSFSDYTFDLPWREEKGYSVLLRKPEFLGYHYLMLTPANLGRIFWQTIPLVLIQGMMNGDMEPDRTTISEASEIGMTYRVNNFTEEVYIPVVFADYLQEIGTIEYMNTIGILNEQVAKVVESKLNQMRAEQNTEPILSEQAVGFRDEEFISKLTNLSVPKKDAEMLLNLTSRNLTLQEAIKFALGKYKEIVAQSNSMES